MTSRKQLRERFDDLLAGIPVWWARPAFRDYDHAPKQHVLVGYSKPDLAEVDEIGRPAHGKYDRQYHALCGYSHINRSETVIGRPYPVRKTTPVVAARCTKCVRELKQLTSMSRTVADALWRGAPYVPPSQRKWPPPSDGVVES